MTSAIIDSIVGQQRIHAPTPIQLNVVRRTGNSKGARCCGRADSLQTLLIPSLTADQPTQQCQLHQPKHQIGHDHGKDDEHDECGHSGLILQKGGRKTHCGGLLLSSSQKLTAGFGGIVQSARAE